MLIKSPLYKSTIYKNKFYIEKCTNQLVCENDGFMNSKCECQCPTSTTGKLCESFIATGKTNTNIYVLF